MAKEPKKCRKGEAVSGGGGHFSFSLNGLYQSIFLCTLTRVHAVLLYQVSQNTWICYSTVSSKFPRSTWWCGYTSQYCSETWKRKYKRWTASPKIYRAERKAFLSSNYLHPGSLTIKAAASSRRSFLSLFEDSILFRKNTIGEAFFHLRHAFCLQAGFRLERRRLSTLHLRGRVCCSAQAWQHAPQSYREAWPNASSCISMPCAQYWFGPEVTLTPHCTLVGHMGFHIMFWYHSDLPTPAFFLFPEMGRATELRPSVLLSHFDSDQRSP